MRHFSQPRGRSWMFNPGNFPGASRFLSVKGRRESPPPTVVAGTVMAGLALLSTAVSNGTARVIVLSR